MMKVYKFETIKDEDEINKIICCIEKNHPFLVIVPAFTQLQQWTQNLSVSWFHDEDETSHNIIKCISDYCFNIASRFISNSTIYKEMHECICICINKLHQLVENRADVLIDKIIKAEICKLSASLMAGCFCERGIRSQILDTSEFMQINLERRPDLPYIQENIRKYLNQNRDIDLFIAPLSLCKNVYGEIDFMSNQRNDYYATILSAAFHAEEITLSTNFVNIFTNQNRMRENHYLTYQEAENLVNTGIHLIYADCITLASRSKITIRLTDTYDLDTERIFISNQDTGNSVKAILTQDSITFVRFTSLNILPGYLFMGKLLDIISKYKINIISMVSSNVSISMLVHTSTDTLRIVQRELYKYAKMVVEENMSAIHIIGSLHWEQTRIESCIMDTIGNIPVSMISYGGDDNCFTISVRTEDKKQLINSLSKQFLDLQPM